MRDLKSETFRPVRPRVIQSAPILRFLAINPPPAALVYSRRGGAAGFEFDRSRAALPTLRVGAAVGLLLTRPNSGTECLRIVPGGLCVWGGMG